MSDTINDDVFDYGNGWRQCISGFGRNTLEIIEEATENADDELRDSIKWHVGEFVRWCRAFNRENQELKAKLKHIADTANKYPFQAIGIYVEQHLKPTPAESTPKPPALSILAAARGSEAGEVEKV